ncbi:MAG: wax ester/triacylglycerol synthase family O-acyltransferase [Aeromicrobium sp.]|jgi:diacylglycerol O-acyltransferase|uniref:WS/DGAT/MGAT family O-acyltransferase n=1 Tax=Aeromicrobium sp. TaxID=1871063 RepID=UPI00260ACF51|nr:wax ester/triacylglycerol synthase family O-acyltransferase [Aeromicrobium sp.]MCW2788512.1 wax ester/triacylglycerol synthase family O-acyltransferase [Aeromicrobium sp.]MCW2823115.1 wax ester/triacylglycerol synthase family O-acyltransferase [Aeromicrobium sp.]
MQRLSPLDAMFLHQDSPTVPRQVASLAILEGGSTPLDYDRLIHVINERIDLVPRYRQVPRSVPGALGTPVWLDDENFDISLHVRRSALPRPGTTAALHELVGRLIARRLDLDRPLWELYLIEGLSGGRVALLFKAHQALVDGSETVDLAQVLLEETAHERDIPHDEWNPRPEPHAAELMLETIGRNVRRPAEALRVTELNLGRLARKLPIIGADAQAPHSVLSTELSRHRRFASLAADLDAFRRVREEHGGTVNDVILAAIAGGIRGWMLTRAEPVTAKTSFRAMVPMSVVAEDGLPTSLGSKVRGHLLSLPVGESNPVVRLHQVSYALKDHRETGSAVAANKLAALPGFATSTFHAVGARVADAEAGRGHQIVITNVPGPQDPLYLAGEAVSEVYPCIPLSGRRALAIGVTSYNRKVFFGIVADRDAVPDVDVLAQCIEDALQELVDTVESRRSRAPRGRQRPTKA